MPSGGPMPGSGRKQVYTYFIDGKKYDSLAEASEFYNVTKKTICKWCNGGKEGCYKAKVEKPTKRKTKTKPKKPKTQPNPQKPTKNLTPDSTLTEIMDAAKVADMTPLDFFLSIMKDVEEEKDLRIKVAYYAAPYMHPKGLEKVGKKEKIKEKAEKAGSGKFTQGKPPLKVIK